MNLCWDYGIRSLRQLFDDIGCSSEICLQATQIFVWAFTCCAAALLEAIECTTGCCKSGLQPIAAMHMKQPHCVGFALLFRAAGTAALS